MSASTQTIASSGRGPAGAPGGSTKAPACPERYTETQAVLHGMFMEEAGSHFLDSGDSYGRASDAHRACPDLLAKPAVAAYYSDDDGEGEDDGGGQDGAKGEDKDGAKGEDEKASSLALRSSFHALDATLEYSAELDAKFERFVAANDDGRKNWTELAEMFAAEKDAAFSWDGNAHNTYWFDNPLDAPFQWLEFDAFVSDGTTDRRQVRAVLVQMHLGCDIRGGYGRPRAFVERHGHSLEYAAKSFDAACKCTHIECFGYGVVNNETAAEECEACAFSSEEDRDSGRQPDGCICDKYPTYWKASGRPDGSVGCGLCGGTVEVS